MINQRGHSGRRDKAEPDIVAALEAQGASVTKLDGKGVPDLLVGHAGRTLLMEVKTDNEGLTEPQQEWHRVWHGAPVPIVRTPAQAVKALRAEHVGGGSWQAVEDAEAKRCAR